MRPILAVGVTAALVVALLGTVFTGVATAQVKGDVTNEELGNLVFHASGNLVKGSGGFAVFDSEEYGYFAGKVDCYFQSSDGTRAAFVDTITKPKTGEKVTFWLRDGGLGADAFLYTDGGTCDSSLMTVRLDLRPASGDLSIR